MNPELEALVDYATRWVQDAAGPAYADQFRSDINSLVLAVSAVLQQSGDTRA